MRKAAETSLDLYARQNEGLLGDLSPTVNSGPMKSRMSLYADLLASILQKLPDAGKWADLKQQGEAVRLQIKLDLDQ